MSRIGKIPIVVPQGVEVSIGDHRVSLKGPKGQLVQEFHPEMTVEFDSKERLLVVKRPSDDRKHKTIHGLTRALLANAVLGVTKGFSRGLEINGLGYTAKIEGKKLVLQVGYIKPVNIEIPQELQVKVTNPTNPAKLIVEGPDKQKVGQFAAIVREVRPVEPYKAKGIKYADEVVRRKAGKTFTATTQ